MNIHQTKSKLQLYKILKNITLVRECLPCIDNCNGLEILCDEITNHKLDLETNSIILCSISSIVRKDSNRLEQLVISGFVLKLIRLSNIKNPVKQFAVKVICEIANFAVISSNQYIKPICNVLVNLMYDDCWRMPAIEALSRWLAKDPALATEISFKSFFGDHTSREILEEDFLYHLYRIISSDSELSWRCFEERLLEFLNCTGSTPKKQIDFIRILVHYVSRREYDWMWQRYQLVKFKTLISRLMELKSSVIVEKAARSCYQKLLTLENLKL